MKKVLFVLALLLVVVFVLASCDTPTVTTTDAGTDGTTQPTGTTVVAETPSATTPVTTEVTTTTTTTTTTPASSAKQEVTTAPVGPEPEPIVTDDYTAVPNQSTWITDSEIDYTKFTYFAPGVEIAQHVTMTYQGYQKNYTTVDAEGNTVTLSSTDVRKYPLAGIAVTVNKDAKKVDILVREIEAKLSAHWTKVTAKAGGYLMFKFTTNLTSKFFVTVTEKAGASDSVAVYKQGNITVSGDKGTYTGIAKCTVPNVVGKTYYINICLDSGSYPVLASIPLTVTAPKYESEFSLRFEGDWELVKREDYLSDLIDLFYNAYPRLYARWGVGDPNVPKTITFVADKDYDGVAYCSGTIVCVSTNYANQAPYDIGFFSHEITHSVQQYGGKLNYGDEQKGKYNGITYEAWWTENMASYGGFRYFHWGYSTKYVQFYDAVKYKNWGENYHGYGDGCQVFLSYLDWKFPTIDENKNGVADPEELGVIDRINYVIKNSTKLIYDTPTDPNTEFSKAVAYATDGKYATLDAIREVFKADIESGAFRCIGFRDYKDNFITENIKGVPNPTYPMWETVEKGSKTAPVLETAVIEGTNLAKGATIVSASSQGGSKNPIANLLDGDINTQWQGAKVTDDYKYELSGYLHEVIIDLGETKTFDTYTLANAGAKSSNKKNNTSEWELFVSDDGKAWTSVDYQNGNTKDIASVNIGDTSARYVMLRIFSTDQGAGSGTVRLCEFMLFDQQ